MELSFSGPFVPWNFRSQDYSFSGTFFLVLQNNQQSSSWSITLMVAVGHGMRTPNRRTSGQLSFEGSWILLLNNNSRKLVPITDCSDSKWVAQPSRRCPYCPEFVSMVCSGPVVRSHQTSLIWINGHMPSDNLVEQQRPDWRVCCISCLY